MCPTHNNTLTGTAKVSTAANFDYVIENGPVIDTVDSTWYFAYEGGIQANTADIINKPVNHIKYASGTTDVSNIVLVVPVLFKDTGCLSNCTS
jgi:hypothetical protein